MAPPPVTIYVTSLTSQPKVRKHIQLLHSALSGLEIPYEAFDLAIDEDAKRRWQRAKPLGMVVGLPGYLVGGEWHGTMDEFEEAVEMGTLESFLKQDTDHADASMTIGEAELDRLMREMTDADLDQLVGDLTIDDIDPAAVKEAVKEDPVVPKAAAVEEPSKAAAVEPVAPVKAVEPVVAVEESVKLPAAEPEAPVKESAATETQSASTGILGTATAAVTIAATTAVATVSETASSVADAAKSLVAEPEGVTAKRADVVAEDKEEEKEASPVATKTEEKEAAPLTAEASLDDVIDKTLAKEAVEAEQKKEKDE